MNMRDQITGIYAVVADQRGLHFHVTEFGTKMKRSSSLRVYKMRMKRKATIKLFILLLSLWCFDSQAWAQPQVETLGPKIPPRLLYEFVNSEGEVFAVGQFVKLEGATVTYRNNNHILETLKLNDLNDEGRQFIKKKVAEQRKMDRLAREAQLAWSTIDRSKPKTVTIACGKLKKCGRAAVKLQGKVKAMFVIEDDRAKLACMSTYPRICTMSFQSVQHLINEMNTDKYNGYQIVYKNPGPFLEGLATMDYLALPYLQHVANTCSLKTPAGWNGEIDDAVVLEFKKGPKNKIRLEAIEAIGTINSPEASAVLVDLAPACEKNNATGERDDKVLEALLKSLGKIGEDNSEVRSVLKRNAEAFPDAVSKAIAKLDKANK